MDMRETAMVSFRGLSRVVAALAGLLVIFAFLVSPLQGADYVELLVGLKPGVAAPAWPDGVTQVRPIPGSRIYRVWVEPARVEEVVATLRASAQVEFVEKAKPVTIQSASTEEKAASRGLQASAERSQFAVIDYEPAEGTSFPAWQGMVRMTYLPWIADGAGVVVAVLDTGLDLENPFLASHAWRNPNEIPGDGLDNDGNGYVDDTVGWDFGDVDNDPQDEHGHGTNVSSIIVTMAPACRILVVKLNQNGSEFFGTGELVEGIYYALAAGAQVVNMSFTVDGASDAVQVALKACHQAGAVLVAAAGHSDGGVQFPASMEEVISVGSLDSSWRPAWFSPEGPELDITAPGVAIETIGLGGATAYGSGTSFSAPMVSGAVAVVRSMNPHLMPETVRNVLLKGTRDLGDPGWDPAYGAGALDGRALWAESVLRLALPWNPVPLYPRQQPLTVSFHLPPTDIEVQVFIGVQGEGFLFWLDSRGGWHDAAAEPLSSLASLALYSHSVDGILLGAGGVFPAFDPGLLPPGSYAWGVAMADESGRLLGPITWTTMILY